MTFQTWIHSETSARLGQVLLHSLWQIAVIGLFALILRAMLTSRVQARYRVSYALLALMAVAPLATWFLSSTVEPVPAAVKTTAPLQPESQQLAEVPIEDMDENQFIDDAPTLIADVPLDTATSPNEISPKANAAAGGTVVKRLGFEKSLLQKSAWLTPLWFIGVLVLAIRQFGGWMLTRQILKTAQPISDSAWQSRLNEIAAAMGITRAVKVMQSTMTDIPMVIGTLRPVVILPVSLLTGLSPAQCEAIFAHELAHVRRYDFLFNLAQIVIETLLFYHPAVWWLSRRIRMDREFCCDDIAARISGSEISLAEGLAALEEMRLNETAAPVSMAPVTVSAAGDGKPGSTLSRVSRILNRTEKSETGKGSWVPGSVVLMMLALLASAWGLSSLHAITKAQRDAAETTVVVAWSAVVDETVLREIRALKSNTFKPDDKTQAETLRVSAYELRSVIKKHLNDDRKAAVTERIEVIRPTASAFAPTGIGHSVNGTQFYREDNGLSIAASWHGHGFAFLESTNEAAKLRLKMEYYFDVDQSNGKATAETTETIGDSRAVGFVITPKGTTGWKPSVLIVYEAVTVPTRQLDFFRPRQAETWVKNGPNEVKTRATRALAWQERTTAGDYPLDAPNTQQLPHGGHVQLIAVSRPDIAPMVWWDPAGQPIDVDEPKQFQADWNQTGLALIRIWEDGAKRNVHRPNTFRFGGGIIDIPERCPEDLDSQLLVVPMIVDETTGQGLLKLGIGTGQWSGDTHLAATKDAQATINGVEITLANIHEFKSQNKTWPAFRWEPTRDWEFTAVAVTKQGQEIGPTSNPTVYVNKPPNTVNGAMTVEHPVLKKDIGHYIIKARPTHWVEFDNFVIEPAIALNPVVNFSSQKDDEDNESKPAAVDDEKDDEDQSASNTNEPVDDINKTRSLANAIKWFNEKSQADPVGKDQQPLTEEEVIAAIGMTAANRDQFDMTDAEFADFQKIAKTRIFPPKVELESLNGFQPDPLTKNTRWSVRIVIPRPVGKGTHAFVIRDTHINTHKINEKTIAWGKPASNGLAYGVTFDPNLNSYPLTDTLKPIFFLRNEGKSPVELPIPNVLYFEPEQILVFDEEGNRIDVKKGHKEFNIPWVAGWRQTGLGPGDFIRLNLPHTLGLGDGKYDDKMGRILDVKQNQKVRLSFEIPNYGNSDKKEMLRTGELMFTVSLPNADKVKKETPATETADKPAEPAKTKQASDKQPTRQAYGRRGVEQLAFTSNDKELLMIGNSRIATIHRWDIATKQVVGETVLTSDKPGRLFHLDTVTFSKDAQRVAIATDEYVGIWETSTGKLLRELAIPEVGEHWVRDVVKRLTCSADLSVVVAGMGTDYHRTTLIYDAYAVVWNGNTGEVTQTIRHKHARDFVGLDVSANGKLLATTGGGGTVIWEAASGKQLREIKNDNKGRKHDDPKVSGKYLNHVWSIRFSPDGKQLAIGDTLGVKLWDVRTGKKTQQFDGAYRYGRPKLVFSQDGQLLARVGSAGLNGGGIPIWSTQTGTRLFELHASSNDGTFAIDGSQFAVGGSRRKAELTVWDLDASGNETSDASQPQKRGWFKMKAETERHRREATSRLIEKLKPAWGEEKQGIQYGLAVDEPNKKFKSGERVPLSLFLRNVSDKPLHVEFSPEFLWNVPAVTNEKGETIQVKKIAALGINPRYQNSLQPGEAYGPFRFSLGLGPNPAPGKQNWYPYLESPAERRYNLKHALEFNVVGLEKGDKPTKETLTSGTIVFDVVDQTAK